MAICNIALTLGIFYDHIVHFVLIWYIFSGLGIMYQEKSGNPGTLVCPLSSGSIKAKPVFRRKKTVIFCPKAQIIAVHVQQKYLILLYYPGNQWYTCR
jgi:hypothetical protein